MIASNSECSERMCRSAIGRVYYAVYLSCSICLLGDDLNDHEKHNKVHVELSNSRLNKNANHKLSNNYGMLKGRRVVADYHMRLPSGSGKEGLDDDIEKFDKDLVKRCIFIANDIIGAVT